MENNEFGVCEKPEEDFWERENETSRTYFTYSPTALGNKSSANKIL